MAFVNCPVELLKVKLQTQYGPATGAIVTTATIKGGVETVVVKPVSWVRSTGIVGFSERELVKSS